MNRIAILNHKKKQIVVFMVDPILLGATIGVAGTAVGALIGLAAEPIKLWTTQRSRRENLRLALYAEIANIMLFFRDRLEAIFGVGDVGDEEFEGFKKVIEALKDADAPGLRAMGEAPNLLWATLQLLGWESASYDVYENVKTTDPTLFYQFDEYAAIDVTYRLLRPHDSNVKLHGLFATSPSEAAKQIQENLTLTFEGIFKTALDKKLLSKVGVSIKRIEQVGVGNEVGNEDGQKHEEEVNSRSQP